MDTLFDDLELHAHLERCLQLTGSSRFREQGTQLHSQAAHLGCSLIYISELPQRAIRLITVTLPRLLMNVGHLASTRQKSAEISH